MIVAIDDRGRHSTSPELLIVTWAKPRLRVFGDDSERQASKVQDCR